MIGIKNAELLFRLENCEIWGIAESKYYENVDDALSTGDIEELIKMKDHASDLCGAIYMAITQGRIDAIEDVLYAAKAIINIYEDSCLKYRIEDYNKKQEQNHDID